jgi:hypothetical protein
MTDETLIARLKWLDEFSHTEKDVMEDDGGEFIIIEQDFTDSSGGEVTKKKIYLPKEFQYNV